LRFALLVSYSYELVRSIAPSRLSVFVLLDRIIASSHLLHYIVNEHYIRLILECQVLSDRFAGRTNHYFKRPIAIQFSKISVWSELWILL
jgi:hypothetical protein